MSKPKHILRKEFEAWARNHYYLQELSFERGAGGDYSEPEMEAAWEVWQAAQTGEEWVVGNNDYHPAAWVPSKALKKLERGYNNSPCILTDGLTEFNDTPLYRDPAGTITAQQRILNRLAEVLGMKAGDADGLITRAVRVRKDAERYQWLKDKREIRIYSVDTAGEHTYITAGRPIGSGRNIDEAIDAEIGKNLAGEETDKSLEVTNQPASNSREWGTIPYACDWVRTDRHSGRGGWK